ncbi:site-specific integrase [bacterium]|nr:site-specific integrase [bacterium]
MNELSNNSEPLFDKHVSKNTSETPTMYDAILVQLNSPRTKRLNHGSTVRNWRSSLACFAPTLKKFSAHNLHDDEMFAEFLDDIERTLREKPLAISTLDTYTQVLHGKLLMFAKVEECIRNDVKQGVRTIKKKQKRTVPKLEAVDDALLVRWLNNIDGYCNDPKTAPNLFKLARPTGKMAYKNTMRLHHMLLLRGFVWLTLASGARTGEIRPLTDANIDEESMTRTIFKMKVTCHEVTSNLPPFIQERIRPMIASIKQHAPKAELLFGEHENKKGKGTIDPRLLQELVRGSMIASGIPPNAAGGQYRLHKLRSVWARWIDENGGSLESTTAFLGHSSTQVTYKSYFHDEHKSKLARKGQQIGLNHLQSLLAPPEDLTDRLAELRAFLERGEGIYADGCFSLRHEIDRTKSARPERWSKLVPAPMSEDVNGGESPHDRAWTNRMATIRVPAPRLELGTP